MNSILKMCAILSLVMSFQTAMADSYSCAKMVYKDGWLTKYEHLGNTWGANTKKHGLVSSSVGSSVEKTTSSVDPGAMTGNLMSSAQYTSSWGECAMVDMHITRQMREDYIEQNMPEIKRQIAIGYGYHIDSLALLSGCRGVGQQNWSTNLQSNTAAFYDLNNSKAFANKLDAVIKGNKGTKAACQLDSLS